MDNITPFDEHDRVNSDYLAKALFIDFGLTWGLLHREIDLR